MNVGMHRVQDTTPSPVDGSVDASTAAKMDPSSFPAKTHALIAHLTHTAPHVACYSPSGSTFYVHNQAILASHYLPQYFKHANWGSFVRQLNLYGFTSSRLKDNSDVVVWSHDWFHRDHLEWSANIKRAKKKKKRENASSKVEFVGGCPEEQGSTSPHSFYEHNTMGLSSADREWIQGEFNSLKQQNRHLEAKLDLLIQYTFKSGGGSSHQSGSKRRRTTVGHWPSSDVEAPPSPMRRSSDRAHGDSQDDSFKSYIGELFTDGNSNKEESKANPLDTRELQPGSPNGSISHAPSSTYSRHSLGAYSAVASVANSLDTGSENLNSQASNVDNRLMEQQFLPPHPNAFYPPPPPNYVPHPHYNPAEWVPRANYASDKMSGPALIYSSQAVPSEVVSSNPNDTEEEKVPEWVTIVPPSRSSTPEAVDEEEGNLNPLDLTLVSARLVESDNGHNENTTRLLVEHSQHVRQTNKRVMFAVAALAVAAVVSLSSAILVEKRETEMVDATKSLNSFFTGDKERRWKDWNVTLMESIAMFSSSGDRAYQDGYVDHDDGSSRWRDDGGSLFDRDFPETIKAKAENVTTFEEEVVYNETAYSDEHKTSYTEFSVNIHGGVEVFHCYHHSSEI